MKAFVIIALLALVVILCEKFEEKLPKPVKFIFSYWKKFSHALGVVMSFIILTILWFVGFGVYGIIMKIVTLPKRFASDPDTYWVEANPSTAETMKHQF